MGSPAKTTKTKTRGHELNARLEQEEDLTMSCPKMWLHDLAQCLQSPSKAIAAANAGDADDQLCTSSSASLAQNLETGCAVALQFAITKKATLDGKEFKSWKPLRHAIKKQLVNNHLILLKSVCNIPDSASLSSAEVADAILKALNDHDDGAQRDAVNPDVALRERE